MILTYLNRDNSVPCTLRVKIIKGKYLLKSKISLSGLSYLLTVNSLWPSDAIWWTWSTLVKKMACHLFGAKPWPEPMSTYCPPDHLWQNSVTCESEYKAQGVQWSGKSQGNSRLCKSQGILLKVREKMNIEKSQGKVWEFAYSAI